MVDYLTQYAQHLIKLSATPGWLDYVKGQVHYWHQHESGLFTELGATVARLRKEAKAKAIADAS